MESEYQTFECPECDGNMVIHRGDSNATMVECHHCGYRCTAGEVRGQKEDEDEA